MGSKRFAGSFSLVLILAFLPFLAFADFDQAVKLHQGKKFEAAFAEFYRLAQLGDYESQFNVGAMYLQGQGVAKNVSKAYAWLALAAQDGKKSHIAARDKVYDALNPEQKLSAEKETAVIATLYNDAALQEKLRPVFSQVSNAQFEVLPIHRVIPKYPIEMSQKGVSGFADIVFMVDRNGYTRNQGVISYSSREFALAAVEALKQWRFRPLMVNGKPVEVYGQIQRFNFKINDADYAEGRIKSRAEKLKKKAEAGNPVDQVDYAYFLQILPTITGVELEDKNYNDWYWRAANGGNSKAQFLLGKNMLWGQACSADTAKSMYWLERAAGQGATDAQYLLAIEMLSGARLARNDAVAIAWLEKAAETGNDNARLKLAWFYATSTQPTSRNGKMAESFLTKVSDEYIDRITLFEVHAAVAAELGDFSAAVKWQKKLIDEAEDNELPTTVFEPELTAYKNKRTWIDKI